MESDEDPFSNLKGVARVSKKYGHPQDGESDCFDAKLNGAWLCHNRSGRYHVGRWRKQT